MVVVYTEPTKAVIREDRSKPDTSSFTPKMWKRVEELMSLWHTENMAILVTKHQRNAEAIKNIWATYKKYKARMEKEGREFYSYNSFRTKLGEGLSVDEIFERGVNKKYAWVGIVWEQILKELDALPEKDREALKTKEGKYIAAHVSRALWYSATLVNGVIKREKDKGNLAFVNLFNKRKGKSCKQ